MKNSANQRSEGHLESFIAHRRERDGTVQTVAQHLRETADLAELFASAADMPRCGRLLGLCHDLGKYSGAFRNYIQGVTGMLGEEAQHEAEAKRGTIDHATAGAQLIWDRLSRSNRGRALAQILAVSVMSHHSRTGMKDFVSLPGSSPFLKRIGRSDTDTHLAEALTHADPEVIQEIHRILKSPELLEEFNAVFAKIQATSHYPIVRRFHLALLTRFLFSSLLDADRTNTADFEKPKAARFRTTGRIPPWGHLANLLEKHLTELIPRNEIDRFRNEISDECRRAASRPRGLFTLTVPTGGGKTLASLRFALHHALKPPPTAVPPIERIIYVIPYTTIIDQNAEEIRGILGDTNVLEHHSNLVPERDKWRNRVLSENWDAPVVLTTSVQLLNALFDAPTGRARRMHQLANAIVIFDEIQTLPIKTIHAFNNAINFLTAFCNTSVVFCTATQPLLGKVDPAQGAACLPEDAEIIKDKKALFTRLKRTEIFDRRRPGGWNYHNVAEFALEQRQKHQSCLIVCNTKKSATQILELLEKNPEVQAIHLSTNMCPAHRKARIKELKTNLSRQTPNPVICVSTQLIEAGVDLDFGCVIRSLAGMDSITQAGGRCNRNGNRPTSPVYVLNFSEETLGRGLREIAEAQEVSRRVLDEFASDPESLDDDLLSEKVMERFYSYHFFQRSNEMNYPLKAGTGNPPVGATTNMIDLLSTNPAGLEPVKRSGAQDVMALPLKQAFSTAAQHFKVIDAPTCGVIVPYGKDGETLIGELASAFATDDYPLEEQIPLLKKAQQFTVNLFPNMIAHLRSENALREIQPDSEILYLDERYYHDDLGVIKDPLSPQKLQFVQ